MSEDTPAPEITPEELVREIRTQSELHVLDVRAPERLAGGRIDLLPPERFHNMVGSVILEMSDPTVGGVTRSTPVAVICNRGIASARVVAHLVRNGYDARSVRGGMAAWMNTLVERPLGAPDGLDHVIQFDRIGKGALSHLLVSEGEALIIDPPRVALPILERAAQLGAMVVGVADTHAHADYISGGIGLSKSLNIPYYLHPADAVYPFDGRTGPVEFESVKEGSEFELGAATIRVEHTPGHTEGSVTYLVGRKVAFTGDFIFIDSIGRPDLGGKMEEWTPILWRSLERAREEWGPSLVIHPAHYAGEDERGKDQAIGAAFGPLQESNKPLAMTDLETLTEWIRNKTGSAPDAYRRIKAVNVGLLEVSEEEATELEIGRNECAVG